MRSRNPVTDQGPLDPSLASRERTVGLGHLVLCYALVGEELLPTPARDEILELLRAHRFRSG
jgi:hypothetical protein